ncbi:MAG: alpha/beta fold hydrolase [Bacteroidia bacterium]|nr:alpha/beta fold hydrolase [Bacteroidia bacterium]
MKRVIYLLVLISQFNGFELKSMSPDKQYTLTPDSLGLSYKDLTIVTSDSVKIHSWLMTPPPSLDKHLTIIISGGDAGKMSNYVYQAYKLVLNGYTVITFDYRGFGSSDSFNINTEMLYYNQFAIDLSAIIQYSKKTFPLSKTGIFAFSMGTIIASIALQQDNIDFYIADGLVTNPFLIAVRLKLLKNKYIILPDSADKVKSYSGNILCPVLVFAGELDEITTVKDAKVFCEESKNRTLVTTGGDHQENINYLSKKEFGDLYFRKILKFLKKIK